MSADAPMLLVLGGARSGKSRHAQRRAEALAGERLYVATAEPIDGEMAARIARHRAERGPGWRTVEAPIALAEAIAHHAARRRVLLIDCLTLWTSNLLLASMDIASARRGLVDALRGRAGPIVLVANEVGLGIVPDNALARAFRDAAGELNQAIAAAADEVLFIAAGLPLTLKREVKGVPGGGIG